jgi:hypothetical protein
VAMRKQRKGSLSHSDNVTKAEANMVRKMTDLCLRELSKKDHELGASYASMKQRCSVHVKYRRQSSYGGSAGITIDLWSLRDGTTHMSEYAAIKSDPVIGSMDCGDVETRVLCVVAHEVAHHVQYRYGPRTRWLAKKYKKPHGEGWQAIYRILRSRVVNPRAVPQEEAA